MSACSCGVILPKWARATVRWLRRSAALFTANDCLDNGADLGSPVSLDCFEKAPFAFNGQIAEVKVKYLQ